MASPTNCDGFQVFNDGVQASSKNSQPCIVGFQAIIDDLAIMSDGLQNATTRLLGSHGALQASVDGLQTINGRLREIIDRLEGVSGGICETGGAWKPPIVACRPTMVVGKP